jgi:signal transduction histidine kinase
MNKRIWIHFLKDELVDSISFFGTIFLIILFYQLTTDGTVEIVYPVSIGIYAYFIWMVIKAVRYYRFQSRLHNSVCNHQYDLKPTTGEQIEVSKAIGAIHRKYLNQIQSLQIEQEAQNRFLSQWIHNLKTPISVIDLLIQNYNTNRIQDPSGLKEGLQINSVITKTQDNIDGLLDSISEENEKLNHSVEQLLSLIRLDNFSKDYVPEKMDLIEEIKKVINGMKKLFVMNHVFPELRIETEDHEVFSDRKWHKLMLEQFITNAIKYSKKGEETKRLYITVTKNEKELLLTVRDEGIGIPEYDLERIFEPFFTGDNGRDVRNSTGIGLYIADMIANKLGHHLKVTSLLGSGTTVTVAYDIPELVFSNKQ